MSRRRCRAAFALWFFTLLITGCVEWLEMPEETNPSVSTTDMPASTPGQERTVYRAARVDAPGPLVPRTPGLRVPEGFWTRVRMDTADAWLPFSWVDLRAATDRGQKADSSMTFRLLAAGGPSEDTRVPPPSLRVVAPLTVPAGTEVSALVGLTLQTDALSDGIVGFDLGGDHPWRVTLEQITLKSITATTISGTLEGTAVRGSRARASRPFQAAFHAYRVPPDEGG